MLPALNEMQEGMSYFFPLNQNGTSQSGSAWVDDLHNSGRQTANCFFPEHVWSSQAALSGGATHTCSNMPAQHCEAEGTQRHVSSMMHVGKALAVSHSSFPYWLKQHGTVD